MGFPCFLCFSGPVGVLAGRDDGRVFLFLSFFLSFLVSFVLVIHVMRLLGGTA